MTHLKRVMITVPDDMSDKLKKLKKNLYFDKSHAELYRELLRLGIQAMEQNCTTNR